ncbi:decaprenyl-phosphate phosphoribosyltransferase [candidate division KSB1 bacterium]
MIIALFKSLRPVQWTKNLLLFAAPIFSLNLFHPDIFLLSCAGFVIFCMISGSTYIINDLFDITADRQHPKKSQRPIAAGEIQPAAAGIFAAALTAGGLVSAFALDLNFGFIAAFYFILTLAYSFRLKHIIILDSLIVALGFMVRTIAGALMIHVDISKWLLICTIFLSLFLALCKRLNELKTAESGEIVTRKILNEYSPELLIHMISIAASSSLIAYTLYTVDNATIEKFGTADLVYTVPFVVYGIFRYIYLIHNKDMGENPEIILLTDKPILINIVLYLIIVLLILYI